MTIQLAVVAAADHYNLRTVLALRGSETQALPCEGCSPCLPCKDYLHINGTVAGKVIVKLVDTVVGKATDTVTASIAVTDKFTTGYDSCGCHRSAAAACSHEVHKPLPQ